LSPEAAAAPAADVAVTEAMGRLVTQGRSMAVVLAGAAELVAASLVADGCLIYQVEPDGELALVACHPASEHMAELRLPAGYGVTGRVAADGVPAVLVDDSPRNPLHRSLLGLHEEGQTVSRLCVPARVPGGPCVAVLALHWRAHRTFEAEEIDRVQRVADLLGLRIALQQAASALADFEHDWDELVEETVSAQEAERRRVAGDLHDGVTQVVASLTFRLSAAEIALQDSDFGYAAEQVRAARELADLAFAETRSAISGLHSPVLEDLGLAAGLVSMGRGVPNLDVRVEAQEVDLPEHVATALFRLAQEGVQNVVKHAAATQAVVRLSRRGHTVQLSITDDGRGFQTPTHLTSMPRMRGAVPRYGLVGMFERVQLLGGQLTITSEPGTGTTVEVVVPLVAS
jgi:two-component system, NarL family, sensor kinase